MVYTKLSEAYNLCSNHTELQTLKGKIQSASNSLPSGTVSDQSGLLKKMDQFEKFSYDLYEAQMEVARYMDSK
jgi:hypothetical protein